MQMQSHPEYTL